MITIKLKYPIQLEGRTVSELEIRRPQVKDIIRAKKTSDEDAEQEVAMVASLAGLPPSAVEDLDISDYKAVQKTLSGFFG